MGSSIRLCALTVLVARVAWASPCDAPVVLGDPELVKLVNEQLTAHGNAGSCTAIRVRLERRDETIVVMRLDAQDGTLEERVVSEPATAATVIESWSAALEAPLLLAPPLEASNRATAAQSPRRSQPVAALAASAPLPSRGVEVMGVVEAAVANDRTTWVGAVAGVCIRVGRICLATRARFATLVDRSGIWAANERHGVDVVFGGDIPFGLGRTTLVAGVGAGGGTVRTSARADGMSEGSVTFGIRADSHITWVIPLAHKLALDLSATLDLAQVTDVETSVHGALAEEPRALARVGAGLRFGGL